MSRSARLVRLAAIALATGVIAAAAGACASPTAPSHATSADSTAPSFSGYSVAQG